MCAALVKYLGEDIVAHLSVGDMLCRIRDDDNYKDRATQNMIKTYLLAQKLLPADVLVFKVLKPELERLATTKKIVFVDGTPREKGQAEYCLQWVCH
jgi:hypothetical protein